MADWTTIRGKAKRDPSSQTTLRQDDGERAAGTPDASGQVRP